MWLSWLIGLLATTSGAQAGFVAGVSAGPAVPLALGSGADAPGPGMTVGGEVGYRFSLGPVHLRPDAIARYNTSARSGAVGVGGAVTFGAPVAFGPYGHIGAGVGGEPGAAGDAGLLAEIGLLKPLLIGVKAGWERTRPDMPDDAGQPYLRQDLVDPVSNWLVVGATIGISL